LVDLALHENTGPVTVAAVAKRQGIPPAYLEQLFHRLRRKGLVAAQRGPRGGYRLKRSPKKIPLSLIFRSLESTPENHKGSVTKLAGRRPLSQGAANFDPTPFVWQQVEEAVHSTLKATTLDALVAQARETTLSPSHRYTFHI